MAGRKALVTGGAGFIGSSLVRELADNGWTVEVYDSLSPGRRDFLPDSPAVSLTVGNILDEAKFTETLKRVSPDVVFHMAAIHYIPYCNAHPQEAMRTNVDGTEAVFRLSQAHSVPRIVFASTAAVYPAFTGALNEVGTPAAPVDIYGYTKWFGEQLAQWMSQQGDTRFAIARLFNVYGPRETSPHLIPALLKQIIEGLEVLKIGNLEPKRDYVYVGDMARGLYGLGAAAEIPAGKPVVANIGTGQEHSVLEVLEALQTVTGRKLEIVQDPDRMRASDRPNLRADVSRLRELIGWAPDTAFLAGMEGLMAWASDNPALMVG